MAVQVSYLTRERVWVLNLLVVAVLAAGCAGTPAPSGVGSTPGPVNVSFSPVMLPTAAPTASPSAVPTLQFVSGTFTSVLTDIPARGEGNLPTPGYADALLDDGAVLIAGGADDNGIAIASAELYRPEGSGAGEFTPTGSMGAARTNFTATTLSDGDVLIAGGVGDNVNGTPLASAELYDPTTGTFTPTGSMATPRENQTALRLPDGKVLILGGDQDCGQNTCKTVASAELYDPTTGTFSLLTKALTGRVNDTVTLLPDGRVLIAGGDDANGAVLATAQIFDPATGKASDTGSLGMPRDYAGATLLSNGQVLIAGGFNGPAAQFVSASAELYDPTSGKFSPTGSMSAARVPSVAVRLPDSDVLVGGGVISGGASATSSSSAEIYDPASGKFTPTGSTVDGDVGRTGLLLPDGRVFVYCHEYGASGNFDAIEIYTP